MRRGGVDVVMMMTLLRYNNNITTLVCVLSLFLHAESRINCLFSVFSLFFVSFGSGSVSHFDFTYKTEGHKRLIYIQ